MAKLTGRLSLGLSSPQWNFLRAEATKLGIGVAELIRRIIDTHREEK